MDNGVGMTNISTPQQEEALDYFDYVMGESTKDKNWTPERNVIVTGHSKGGNKAQFVTLNSVYGAYIDKCYSLDGQGFSPEAIEAFKEKYGVRAYYEQLDKMYSICGENDYVNGLGIPVIKEENTFYLETPVDDTDFYNLHHITGMYAYRDENGNVQFGGILNKETEQGSVGKLAATLSREMMKLPRDQRNDIAMTVMQVLEYYMNEGEDPYYTGLHGEQITLENVSGLIADGIPLVLVNLLKTPEGREVLLIYGPELLRQYYDEHGAWKTAGLILAINVLLPVVVGIGKAIHYIASFINSIYDFVNSVKEFAKDAAEFIQRCGQIIMEAYERISQWYNENFNRGYKYAVANPFIKLNTGDLRYYADRFESINSKLCALDRRLDSLYDDLLLDLDISSLWNLFKADLLTG